MAKEPKTKSKAKTKTTKKSAAKAKPKAAPESTKAKSKAAPAKAKAKAKAAPKTPPAPQPSPFEALRREVDQIFERMQTGDWRWPAMRDAAEWRLPGWPGWDVSLAANLVEKNGGFELSAEMPGLTEEDIEIRVANGMLTISGEKSEETDDAGGGDYHISERRFGSVQRSFRLPEGVDADRIAAHMANGVLTVTLPKTPAAQARPKTIAVKKKP